MRMTKSQQSQKLQEGLRLAAEVRRIGRIPVVNILEETPTAVPCATLRPAAGRRSALLLSAA